MKRLLNLPARPKQLRLWSLKNHSSAANLSRVLTAADFEAACNDAEGKFWQTAAKWVMPIFLGLGTASALSEVARCDTEARSVLIDTRVKMMDLWSECNRDLQELEDSSPWLSMGRLRSPDVEQVGDRISIKIRPISKLHPNSLSTFLNQLFRTDPSLRFSQVSVRRTQQDGTWQESIQLGSSLAVQATVSSNQGSEQSTIEFLVDRTVGLSEQELQIIAATMRNAANYSKVPSGRGTFFLAGGSTSMWHGGINENQTDLSVRDLANVFGAGDFLNQLEEELHRGLGEFSGALQRFRHPFIEDEEHAHDSASSSPGFGRYRALDDSLGRSHLDMQALKEEELKQSGRPDLGSAQANKAVKELEKLGAIVYYPGEQKDKVDWGSLAGYEEQKEQMEENLLLPLLHPEVYDGISSKTRQSKGGTRPRAVIFEGPPGCGKTSSARVLASQASAPLVYVPVEAIFTKFYGESEQNLSKIFQNAEKLDGCLVFLDEIDSLATTRGGDMHEATRRVLGVLLRQMDGFESKRSVIIGATNRKEDLDPALRSRFDAAIYFQLPNLSCRAQILAKYAQQLSKEDLVEVATACSGMSGRDLRDICESAERRVASKIVKGQLKDGSLPTLQDYIHAANTRQKEKQKSVYPFMPIKAHGSAQL